MLRARPVAGLRRENRKPFPRRRLIQPGIEADETDRGGVIFGNGKRRSELKAVSSTQGMYAQKPLRQRDNASARLYLIPHSGQGGETSQLLRNFVRRQGAVSFPSGESGGVFHLGAPPDGHPVVFFKNAQCPPPVRLVDTEGDKGGGIPKVHR